MVLQTHKTQTHSEYVNSISYYDHIKSIEIIFLLGNCLLQILRRPVLTILVGIQIKKLTDYLNFSISYWKILCETCVKILSLHYEN